MWLDSPPGTFLSKEEVEESGQLVQSAFGLAQQLGLRHCVHGVGGGQLRTGGSPHRANAFIAAGHGSFGLLLGFGGDRNSRDQLDQVALGQVYGGPADHGIAVEDVAAFQGVVVVPRLRGRGDQRQQQGQTLHVRAPLSMASRMGTDASGGNSRNDFAPLSGSNASIVAVRMIGVRFSVPCFTVCMLQNLARSNQNPTSPHPAVM